jgi:two-component system sensor histidine kinase KdpD
VVRSSSWFSRLIAYVVSLGGVTVVARIMAMFGVNAAGAAPVMLLGVLLIARAWGIGPALAGSIAGALLFSYYFLPPVGISIESVDDWVAFGTFTTTAIVVGELAARAERRQAQLEDGKREIEQLYQQLGAAFDRASEAEAARRNEQLKSALLDALTHNLRTPLTAIKASVTALLGVADNDSSLSRDSRRDLLLVIDEESDRLNRFIEGLAVADRPDPSHPLSFRAVPVEQVVKEAVARAETVARRHHVAVLVTPGLPDLTVDRSAINEVLYTLLDNASKYAPLNSTIRVRAGRADEHHVRITVEDEGPGIAPQLREQVFQKFFRIPGRESVDPRRTGIGLGLPIARRLVESQAGQITIEDPPAGRGTCVALTLPCVAPKADPETADAQLATRP